MSCFKLRHRTQAIEYAQKYLPNILFLDIMIPEKDGLSVLKEVRTFLPKATFVIISAVSEFSLAQQAIDLNVHKYLLKPVTPREIEGIVQGVIDQQKKIADVAIKMTANSKYEEQFWFIQ